MQRPQFRWPCSSWYSRWPAARRAADAELGAHRIGFVEVECCGDPALDTRIARGELAAALDRTEHGGRCARSSRSTSV